TRPSGLMPNASRPAASLSPPRPTYGCSGSVISIGAPTGMGWEARLATRPVTVTTPARMRLWARARLSTSPRRTMARSNRSVATESFPGSVFDAAVVLASFRELLKIKRSGALLAVLILDEDLHLALGFLKHFETDLGELDALLEDPHGVFKRQFAALQFGDDRFQPGQRFFEFDRGHSSAPSTAHYTPPGFRINSLAVFWTSHNSSPAASRTCTTSPGATADAGRKAVSARRPQVFQAVHLSQAQSHFQLVSALHGARHERGRIEEAASLGFHTRVQIPEDGPDGMHGAVPIADDPLEEVGPVSHHQFGGRR